MNIQNMLGELLGQASAQLGGQQTPQDTSAPAHEGYSGKQMAGGMAVSGVLGLLMGNKKARKKLGKLGGGVVGYGGAAALGAAAHAAYGKWQAQQSQQAATPAPVAPQPLALEAPDERAVPFQLMLVKAMIVASNADGHIDAEERASIQQALQQLPMEADHKALMLDTMFDPPSVRTIAGAADTMEQASAIYLASRMAIDPDHPAERAYLDNLAAAMALPDDLVRTIEEQASEASPA
ncbi:tellurite resistance TerB family protein [Rhizobiaceae bacterium]|nr:tellurite resistance TerB family protein [Rhizobiaceae bacterium]